MSRAITFIGRIRGQPLSTRMDDVNPGYRTWFDNTAEEAGIIAPSSKSTDDVCAEARHKLAVATLNQSDNVHDLRRLVKLLDPVANPSDYFGRDGFLTDHLLLFVVAVAMHQFEPEYVRWWLFQEGMEEQCHAYLDKLFLAVPNEMEAFADGFLNKIRTEMCTGRITLHTHLAEIVRIAMENVHTAPTENIMNTPLKIIVPVVEDIRYYYSEDHQQWVTEKKVRITRGL